ncbi:MAG: helix-turn-helix domain-containing protein [Acidimicrobiia bacterium]
MSTELNQAFGEVVRELRHDRDLSQEALSFACGRHRTYVSLLERGRNSPSLDTLWTIADALGVAASEIIERVERRLAQPRRRRRPRASA